MLICIAALAVWALFLVWLVMFGRHNDIHITDTIASMRPHTSHQDGGSGYRLGLITGRSGTLSTEEVLKGLDHTNLPQELIDGLKREFHEHFGDRVPVDVVMRFVEEYEENFGPLGLELSKDGSGEHQ